MAARGTSWSRSASLAASSCPCADRARSGAERRWPVVSVTACRISRRRGMAARIERRRGMCLSCGCGEPNDDHGDPDHITYDDLRMAATAADLTLEQAADNIKAGLANA